MENMEVKKQLTADDYRIIAVFWFCLAGERRLWGDFREGRFEIWTRTLDIPLDILRRCLDTIKKVESCFASARQALRGEVCPDPPCNLDFTDEQRERILDLLLSFATPGETK
jgi:hypothetical protein